MALRQVDKLLAGYLLFVTAVVVARGNVARADHLALLGMHLLFAVLLALLVRLDGARHRWGVILHDLYPLLLLLPLYAEIGVLNDAVGRAIVFENDAIVQGVEAALFGEQVSYTWIRRYPSVFWSGLLHLAYFAYYPIVLLGPVVLMGRGNRVGARFVILATMAAFVICYVWFVLFPVAGPNYAFEHPTGPVREVWSARLVYGVLAGGSSFGAAFPSSHVAATVAATLGVWRSWRALGWSFVIPAILLVIGTVYCQMHYAVDATAGLVAGGAGYGIAVLTAGRQAAPPTGTTPEHGATPQ